MKDEKIPLVVMVGPTAVGKTAYSIPLAQRLRAEIISADSRLLYIGMDIGTAKPSPKERAIVPHHLIDVAFPDVPWNLAQFKNAAYQAIQAIHQRGHLPILVGGTGQYVRAILEGWNIPQILPNPQLRQALERWAEEITPAGLHHRLAVLDPQSANQIEFQNVRRTIRALEVILTSGNKFSHQRRRIPPPFRTLVLGLTRPRAELFARIDTRIEKMIQNGFIDEVEKLLAAGYSPQLPTMTAIGYREIIAMLNKQLPLADAIKEIRRRTRVFVRRQANWFKLDDPNIHWIEANHETLNEMGKMVREWLYQNRPA
jgi:tRNA dimethylallyltransferase